ncbi:MAG: aminotransferase class V-fold PLP-dependent enzyme, partial [Acidobacteria bacterium]|nr:aminotransferase class V-fold PLP-dependent enzyme [Acidobacteriota bacterium]
MNRRAFLAATGGALTALHADAEERIGKAVARLGAQSAEDAAQDEDFWFRVREAFTIDRNHINLNSGSVSPA